MKKRLTLNLEEEYINEIKLAAKSAGLTLSQYLTSSFVPVKKPAKIIRSAHDRAFKRAFEKKEIASDFFKSYLPDNIKKYVDFDNLHLENKSYIDEQLSAKYSDIVYKTRVRETQALLYILFEHQSSTDYLMAFRLLCYIINIWKEYLDQYTIKKKDKTSMGEFKFPVVIPLLLYNGTSDWTPPLKLIELVDDGHKFKKYIPDFEYKIFDLSSYNDKDFKKDNALPILYLMKHIFDEDFSIMFGQFVDVFTPYRNHPMVMDFLEWTFHYVFNARKESHAELIRVIEKKGEQLNNNKINIRRTAMTAAEQLQQIGEKIGEKIGERKGEKKVILMILKDRFGKLPGNLETDLKKSTPRSLTKLRKSLFDFNSIDDVYNWWNLYGKTVKNR